MVNKIKQTNQQEQAEHPNFGYWNQLLQDPSNAYSKWFEAEKQYLLKNIKENSDILEIGCGEGRSLKYLIEKKSRLFGIDFDSKAALYGRNRFHDNINTTIMLMNAENLIFKDSVFDYVLSLTTPANFGSQKNQIYSEMKRVLRPDGEIIINVFNEDAFDERMKFYKGLNAKIKRIEGTTVIFEEDGGEFVSEQFSRKQLENLCHENRLRVIDITKAGIGYLCRFGKG